MKANYSNDPVTVDSVLVSFSFPKDPEKKNRTVALIGKKSKGMKPDIIGHFSGEAALALYKTLTGKDAYKEENK